MNKIPEVIVINIHHSEATKKIPVIITLCAKTEVLENEDPNVILETILRYSRDIVKLEKDTTFGLAIINEEGKSHIDKFRSMLGGE